MLCPRPTKGATFRIPLLCRVDTKPNNASFRQNFTHPALKSLGRRQPACDFLPCLRKIYARKSAYYLSVNTLWLKNHGKNYFSSRDFVYIGAHNNSSADFQPTPASEANMHRKLRNCKLMCFHFFNTLPPF